MGNDKLVDLCRAEVPPVSAGGGAPGAGPGPGFGGMLTANLFPPPTKDASWLRYEVHTRVVMDTGAMVVKTLPDEPLERAELRSDTWNVGQTGALPLAAGSALPPVVKKPGGSLQAAFAGSGDTTIQHRTTPAVHVYVTGVAVRYGYDIPHPQLISVNGFPATLITDGTPGEGFKSRVVGYAAYPVFRASWNLHYVVPGLRTTPGALPNPIWAPPG
ncbi:hypothetical protein J8F10_15955 [Gemmata sp. G18]|uniref:Uncharacterized protein n=1 Tax=Gemmata palustris TaxID=2822762 RepID=A0ABS5BSQ3_9BACT|nr:hypothetical protein [Gemmata palustris]MBP3956767.1 hypothetical protein [Gemmata palustris]